MSYPNPDEHDHHDHHEPHEHHENQIDESEISAQKEQILKQILSADARLRLNNVKMVKPDLANLVENYLIGMTTQGKINSQISDEQLKQILLSIQQPKRDFKITRR
ncbi:MAG: DNA-binding protein [Nitrosopumilaceae archaeon]